MRNTPRWVLLGGTLGLGLLAASALPAAADVLMIQGSTTFNSRLVVPYQAEIEATSGYKLVVIPNKSSVGLLALLEERTDLAMISTALESEVALLKKGNPAMPLERLHSFPISQTRAAFAVHPSNPVRSLDAATMRRILLGEIGNWKMLGGPDLALKVVVVREGGGVQLSVEGALLDGKHMKPHDPIMVGLADQVVQAVAQEPGALGLAQSGILQKSGLPELVTDRVIQQQLSLVSRDEPTAARQAVIDAARTVANAHLK
jgi:phosphate transport system substrate-binding protein